jgi:hypothetical protein
MSHPCDEVRSKSPSPGNPTRTLVPVFTKWEFQGADEYLEDLVARIDVPLLDNLYIAFFHQQIFDTSQLDQFIRRTPKFNAHHEARAVFSKQGISVTLPQTLEGRFHLEILSVWPPP